MLMGKFLGGVGDVVLLARDLLEQDWTCTALEVFCGKIRVPRPVEDDRDAYEDWLENCRAKQRGVVRQLARLTKLQKLYLGSEYYTHYDVLKHDCLELTLESGLGELVGLKELDRKSVV